MIYFPSDKETEAQIALQTYYRYALAINLAAENLEAVLNRQKELEGFQKLQGDKKVDLDSIRRPLCRGLLTLKAMEILPIDDNSELAMTANFWAPVQAYYALHAIGLATPAALGAPTVTNHRAFRSVMSDRVVPKLLPWPFNITCLGNPISKAVNSTVLRNCSKGVNEIRSISNLSQPTAETAELLVGKVLMTTRARLLEEIFKGARRRDVRKGRKNRNLNAAEKEKLSSSLHPTTIFDFFYRIRVRSNYDDAEMYIYGQGEGATANTHYNNLLGLTNLLADLLKSVIEKKIGSEKFMALKPTLPNRVPSHSGF